MSSLTFPTNLGQIIDQDGGFPHVRISHNEEGAEIDNIHLYVPAQITLADGASYEGVDLAKSGSLKNLTGGQEITSDDVKGGLKAAGASLGGLAGEVTAAESIQSRVALNPNQQMAFTSMNVRTIQLSFDMVPESVQDAISIRRIISFFRKYMYPKKSGGTGFTLTYPAVWRIQFYTGEEESAFMPTFYDSYCTGLDVNYQSEAGSWIALKAGQDVVDYIGTKLTMGLQFSESKMLTRDDMYEDSATKSGPVEIRDENRGPILVGTKPKGEGGNG